MLILDAQQYLLEPKLVTGCKIWHLRPETKFHTRAGWQHAICSIPCGSQVLVHPLNLSVWGHAMKACSHQRMAGGSTEHAYDTIMAVHPSTSLCMLLTTLSEAHMSSQHCGT